MLAKEESTEKTPHAESLSNVSSTSMDAYHERTVSSAHWADAAGRSSEMICNSSWRRSRG